MQAVWSGGRGLSIFRSVAILNTWTVLYDLKEMTFVWEQCFILSVM